MLKEKKMGNLIAKDLYGQGDIRYRHSATTDESEAITNMRAFSHNHQSTSTDDLGWTLEYNNTPQDDLTQLYITWVSYGIASILHMTSYLGFWRYHISRIGSPFTASVVLFSSLCGLVLFLGVTSRVVGGIWVNQKPFVEGPTLWMSRACLLLWVVQDLPLLVCNVVAYTRVGFADTFQSLSFFFSVVFGVAVPWYYWQGFAVDWLDNTAREEYEKRVAMRQRVWATTSQSMGRQ